MISLSKKVRNSSESIESYACKCTCTVQCKCGAIVYATSYITAAYNDGATSNHYAK